MTAVAYPRLIRRIRASMIDSVAIPVGVIAVVLAGERLGVSGGNGRILLIVVPILVLEPLLVSLTGGTIGHHLLKIRVVTRDGTRNINLAAAMVRFLVKASLGWLSFITVFRTAKHQAIHDWVARTVVILKDAEQLPDHESLSERMPGADAFRYPAVWRRIAVTVAYVVLLSVAVIFFGVQSISAGCSHEDRCTAGEAVISFVLTVAWMAGIAGLLVGGWSGRLPGAKRRPRGAT
ncbi:MAG: RDD family protein [Burkholderiales bacterium]